VAEPKTKANNASVAAFVSAIPDVQVRQDCRTIVAIMQAATKAKPRMWGTSIVGFGQYHSAYASGQKATWMLTGFAPRKQRITLHIMDGFKQYDALLANVGTHACGKSCFHIKHLADVHLPTLKQLVKASVKHRLRTSAPAQRKRSNARPAGASAG